MWSEIWHWSVRIYWVGGYVLLGGLLLGIIYTMYMLIKEAVRGDDE